MAVDPPGVGMKMGDGDLLFIILLRPLRNTWSLFRKSWFFST